MKTIDKVLEKVMGNNPVIDPFCMIRSLHAIGYTVRIEETGVRVIGNGIYRKYRTIQDAYKYLS